MKVEIDSEELKRLKSREEKYLAYMDMLSYRGEDKTYVDALCGKVAELEEENKDLVEKIEKLLWEKIKLEEENKKLKEKLSEITMMVDDEKQSIEHILELEEEIRSLELENRAMKVESEELKMRLREKLPLALLKEYMDKFEGVDLKNV